MTKRIWIIDGSYLYKSTPERFDYLRLKNELQTILGIHLRNRIISTHACRGQHRRSCLLINGCKRRTHRAAINRQTV